MKKQVKKYNEKLLSERCKGRRATDSKNAGKNAVKQEKNAPQFTDMDKIA